MDDDKTARCPNCGLWTYLPDAMVCEELTCRHCGKQFIVDPSAATSIPSSVRFRATVVFTLRVLKVLVALVVGVLVVGTFGAGCMGCWGLWQWLRNAALPKA